jgi:hypothetical protein
MWISAKGYVTTRIDGKVVSVHRVLMEKKLGRKLLIHECVHHINGNRTDNRLENLEVLDVAEHTRHHRLTNSPLSRERAKQMSIAGHKARWGHG